MNFETPLKIINLIKRILPDDNKGALLIPFDLKIRDVEYKGYRHLPVNWDVEVPSKDMLPEDFSRRAVELVNMFRRKTIDLDYEIMLIFDYKTAELIYCFTGDGYKDDEVYGQVDDEFLEGKNIAVIHNHPTEFGSPPSYENFQILSLNFEDYEIISSWEEIWIIESKEVIPENELDVVKQDIREFYENLDEIAENTDFNKTTQLNKVYGDFLLQYFKNSHLNVNLIKQELKYDN